MSKTMKDFLPFYLGFVEQYVVKELVERYGMEAFEALRRFLGSETYRMLSDPELAMWEFSHPAILAMWVCEQVTGDPRNSVYIRGE